MIDICIVQADEKTARRENEENNQTPINQGKPPICSIVAAAMISYLRHQ